MESIELVSKKLQEIMTDHHALERFLIAELCIEPGNIITRDSTLKRACWEVGKWALSEYELSNLVFALRDAHPNVPMDDLEMLLLSESKVELSEDNRKVLLAAITP